VLEYRTRRERGRREEGGEIDGNKKAKSEIINCSRGALPCCRAGKSLIWSVLLEGRKEGSEAKRADKQVGIKQRGARLSDELKK